MLARRRTWTLLSCLVLLLPVARGGLKKGLQGEHGSLLLETAVRHGVRRVIGSKRQLRNAVQDKHCKANCEPKEPSTNAPTECKAKAEKEYASFDCYLCASPNGRPSSCVYSGCASNCDDKCRFDSAGERANWQHNGNPLFFDCEDNCEVTIKGCIDSVVERTVEHDHDKHQHGSKSTAVRLAKVRRAKALDQNGAGREVQGPIDKAGF